MNIGLQQSMRPELQLRLSPQILQRIEVLQLPALDLKALVEQELQQNETLEVDQDSPSDGEITDERLEELYAEEEEQWRPGPRDDIPSRTDVIEDRQAAPVTLGDHLRGQLDLLELAPRVRALTEAIVEALDARGWLTVDLSEVSAGLEPPATLEEKEHALHVVQDLDPPGVACRDMVECLLLQLDEKDPGYQLQATLVMQHLDDIAHNRIPRIAREAGVPVEKVLEIIDAISHLDPLPGRRFGDEQVPFVRPDVVVRRVDDDYEISLENDWIPSLTVSRSYLRMARDRSVDPELRKHIRGKIESAQSLIDAVEQRKNTLFRVASELVNRQADYLEHGKARLRPLRMQEVADALGVHVSTVSRAISGKYMQTPRGIVPMKALFTGEVGGQGGDGEQASRASVQETIRDIIAKEDPRQPLSDEAIVALLRDGHGLDIARRTVTKYRKALKIGSSRARRVYGSA